MTTPPRIINNTAICRVCHGDGRIWQPTEGMPQHENGHWTICPLCLGSGMVNVRITTTLTITPKQSTPVRNETK